MKSINSNIAPTPAQKPDHIESASWNMPAIAKLETILHGKKVVYIATKNLDYIRVVQEVRLLQSLASQVTIIGSQKRNYPERLQEVYNKIHRYDFSDEEEVIFIGFAPQLILPIFHKKFAEHLVIQDFFISFYDTLVQDRRKIREGSPAARTLHRLDEKTIGYGTLVIADTNADADYFAREFHRPRQDMMTLYLEADTSIYHINEKGELGKGELPEKPTITEGTQRDAPNEAQQQAKTKKTPLASARKKFRVLYFGSILPLQGVDIVLSAARQVCIGGVPATPIEFEIIGPLGTDSKVDVPGIHYIDWLPQAELAAHIAAADLCLAGHFSGKIEKARRTIAGKTFIYRAMHKPVILGDNPANHELFQETPGQIYYCRMGDANNLAQTILRASQELVGQKAADDSTTSANMGKTASGSLFETRQKQIRAADSPLISIIVPVYNVLPWLDQCIQSVVDQTYQNLDILLVDDGSNDGSENRCTYWSQKDPRIRVIHQANGGLSAARNTGLEAARGEYLFFLDSDDYILPSCIESLYDMIDKTQADIAICGFHVQKESTDTRQNKTKCILQTTPKKQPCLQLHHHECKLYSKDFYNKEIRHFSTTPKTSDKAADREDTSVSAFMKVSRQELQQKLLYQQSVSTSAWGKLYRRSLFQDVRFEEGKLFEDIVPVFELSCRADRAVITTREYYVYRVRQGSITKTQFRLQQLDYVRNCHKLQKLVRKSCPELEKGAVNRLVWAELYVITHSKRGDIPRQTEDRLWRHITAHRAMILQDAQTTPKVRGVLLLSFGGKEFLRAAFRLSQRK